MAKEDVHTLPMNIPKYDSVKFFKDAVWTSYKGLNELPENNLYYPYTALAYLGNSIKEVFIVFGKGDVRIKYFKNYKGLLYIQSKYYNPEFKTIMYQYKFLKNNGSSITFDCTNASLQDSIKVNTLYYEKDSLNIHNNKYFAWGFTNSSLKDLLSFNKEKLRSAFREYGEERLEMKNAKLYRTHSLSEQLSLKRITQRDDIFLQNKNLKYTSFFYFYNYQKLYESIP